MKTRIVRSAFAPSRLAATALGLSALVLGACQAPADSAPAPAAEANAGRAAGAVDPAAPAEVAAVAPVADFRVAVDGEGLRLVQADTGSTRPLAFGAAQAQVLAALEPGRGAAAQGRNGECNSDYANWADGLSLNFVDGRFVGWSLDQRAAGAISTMAGVGPGSTRAELDSAYSARASQTTLGTEFSAGGLNGVLSGPGPEAKITDMWAGTTCIAR